MEQAAAEAFGKTSPILNVQPIVNKIAEVADVGTLVLLLVIFLLMFLFVMERSRNNGLVKLYMDQSTKTVEVLSNVKNLMDAHTRLLETNEEAMNGVKDRLNELQFIDKYLYKHDKGRG